MVSGLSFPNPGDETTLSVLSERRTTRMEYLAGFSFANSDASIPNRNSPEGTCSKASRGSSSLADRNGRIAMSGTFPFSSRISKERRTEYSPFFSDVNLIGNDVRDPGPGLGVAPADLAAAMDSALTS